MFKWVCYGCGTRNPLWLLICTRCFKPKLGKK